VYIIAPTIVSELFFLSFFLSLQLRILVGRHNQVFPNLDFRLITGYYDCDKYNNWITNTPDKLSALKHWIVAGIGLDKIHSSTEITFSRAGEVS
jgi:hypothetical protein